MSTKMARLSNGSNCEELEGDGTLSCEKSRSLEILNEIKQIYEDRLRRTDEEGGNAGIELKLRILQSWVVDLGEQNDILVQTIEQLEHEANERVTLLKDGLDRSARSALTFMNRLDDQAIGHKVVPQDRNEELLHTKVRNLQNDITNLLELIRRAREESNWDITGLVFTEVTFDDIFDSFPTPFGQENGLPTVSKEKDAIIEDLKAEINVLNTRLKQHYGSDDNEGSKILKLQEEVLTLREDNLLKEGQIQGFIKRVQNLQSNIVEHNEEGSSELIYEQGVEQSFTHLDIHISKALRERNALTREVHDLTSNLERRTTEVELLTKTVSEMDQAAKDMREALTAEVADKHDRILALRREIQLLEERCHQADMQTHFKDNIIKEMRKDLKIAKTKLASHNLELHDGQNSLSSAISSNQELHLSNILQQLYQHKEMCRSPTSHSQYSNATQITATYQQNSTPGKLTRSIDERSCYSGSCENVSQQFNTSYVEGDSYASDLADQLATDETYYEVRRRHSPSKEDHNANEKQSHSGVKEDSTSLHGIRKKEMEFREVVEHLKHKLLMRDNKIKQQEKSIKDLEDLLRKYESELDEFRIKTKETEVELEDMKLKLINQVGGTICEDVLDYHLSLEGGDNAWTDLIQRMKELALNLKARENKISLQDSTVTKLQDRLKQSQIEIDALKGKCASYLEDIQTAEQNQSDSERRILELKDVLTKAHCGIQESLGYIAMDANVAQLLKSQDVKSFHEKAEESQEAFNNLKAELNYLTFYLKSREKQVKYLVGLVNFLNDLMDGTHKDLEDLKNETFTFKKEKENLHNDHEKSMQKIEQLEKNMKLIEEEKQKSKKGLDFQVEEEAFKIQIIDLQNNMKKYTDEVQELNMINSKLKKELQDANTKIKELERNVDLLQSKELDAKAKLEALQSTLTTKEKVVKDQQEMIKILQDSVNIVQKEQEDLRKQLKDSEIEKEKVMHDLEEYEKKAGNLQEALMITKTHLEDLQGKGDVQGGVQDNTRQPGDVKESKYELGIKDRIIRFLHKDLSEIQSQYNSCYGEVIKQEKVLDTLRDSNEDLRIDIMKLEQDVGILEYQLAEKIKTLDFTKGRTEELEKRLSNRNLTINELSEKVKTLEEEIINLRIDKEELLRTVKDQTEIKNWEQKCFELKTDYELMEKRNVTLAREVDLLKDTLEEYKLQIKSLVQSSTSAEVNKCFATFKSLEEKLTTMNSLLKEKSENLARVQAGYQMLQDELDVANQRYNNLESSALEEVSNFKYKIKDLEDRLQRTESAYYHLSEDDKKHQRMLMEATNRETYLKRELAEREEAQINQNKNSVDKLNKELQHIKAELTERDCQLQAVATQNQFSVRTIEKLQNELETKVDLVRNLQANVNEVNASLVGSMKKLEEKQIQLQELQAEVTKLKCRLDFTEGHRGTTCEEVCTLQRESIRLKSEIRRLMMIQEKAASEVREYLSLPESWWWDDFWQI